MSRSTREFGFLRSRRILFLILAADVVWIVLGVYLAYQCRYGFSMSIDAMRDCFSLFGETAIAAVLIWIFLAMVMRLDGFQGGWTFRSVFSDLFLGVFLLMALLLANGYLARVYHSRLVFIYFGFVALAGFLVIRCLSWRVLRSRYFAASVRRVVILGGGRIARELTTKINRHPEMGWQVVGYLCPDLENGFPAGAEEEIQRLPTLGVGDFLAAHQVDEIIVAMANPARQTLDLVARCRRLGIRVLVVPQAYELYISRPSLAEIDGLPLIAIDEYDLPAGAPAIRRLTDLALAPLMLAAVLPIMLAAAGALVLRKGKAIRRELRCGKDGKTFWMYRLNVDRGLPELPAYEKLLVDLGLTEVPQLWNVLRGDMDLVGPRPEPPKRVKHYSDWQRQRLKIKPGITGLAQIYGLRDQHSAEQKTHYDLQYILRWSPFLDLSLILQTAWTPLSRLWRRKPAQGEALPVHSLWPVEAEKPLEEIAYVDHS
ncbi:MAG TPA: sugar transferase [Terriglobia bacterium]|nr:sugar transferase [Terriglobia bacterium]